MNGEADTEMLLIMIVFAWDQTEPSSGYRRARDFTVDVPQRTMGFGQAGECSVSFTLSLSEFKITNCIGIDADVLI